MLLHSDVITYIKYTRDVVLFSVNRSGKCFEMITEGWNDKGRHMNNKDSTGTCTISYHTKLNKVTNQKKRLG